MRLGGTRLGAKQWSFAGEQLLSFLPEEGGGESLDAGEDLVEVVGIAESGIQGHVLHGGISFHHAPHGAFEPEAGDLPGNCAAE